MSAESAQHGQKRHWLFPKSPDPPSQDQPLALSNATTSLAIRQLPPDLFPANTINGTYVLHQTLQRLSTEDRQTLETYISPD